MRKSIGNSILVDLLSWFIRIFNGFRCIFGWQLIDVLFGIWSLVTVAINYFVAIVSCFGSGNGLTALTSLLRDRVLSLPLPDWIFDRIGFIYLGIQIQVPLIIPCLGRRIEC